MTEKRPTHVTIKPVYMRVNDKLEKVAAGTPVVLSKKNPSSRFFKPYVEGETIDTTEAKAPPPPVKK